MVGADEVGSSESSTDWEIERERRGKTGIHGGSLDCEFSGLEQ